MRQLTKEEISVQKTVARAAYNKGIINESSYARMMRNLNQLEVIMQNQDQLKAKRFNELKHKLNEYVTH